MRRSGNHVFADWLKSLGDGGWTHYNNCILRERGLVETGSPVVGDGENILITFEDCKFHETIEKLPKNKSILLLRDPYNLFASRLKHIRTKEDSPIEMICNDAIRTWKENITSNTLEVEEAHAFLFNSWYKNEWYRESAAKVLGFEFSDEGFGSKAGWKFSGGSSFGNDPDPMNSYYNHMFDDKEFLSMFDEEMIGHAQFYFHMPPPTNAKYDKKYHEGVEQAVTEVLWAVHCGTEGSARSLLQENQNKFPNSSRLSQLLHYV